METRGAERPEWALGEHCETPRERQWWWRTGGAGWVGLPATEERNAGGKAASCVRVERSGNGRSVRNSVLIEFEMPVKSEFTYGKQ